MKEVLITALAGVLSAATSWFFARRKNLAETQSNELDNATKGLKYYQELVEDLGKQQKILLDEMAKVKQDFADLLIKYEVVLVENRKLKAELNSKKLNGNHATVSP